MPVISRYAACLSVLLAVFFAPAFAQQSVFPSNRDVQFQHLTVDQGLSQTSVAEIYQDAQGFLWFGTSDGLNKFDGYDVTVYKQDPDNPNSLAGNSIMSIYEAPSEPGVLWIGTTNTGLTRFDRDTGTFTHFRHHPDSSNGLKHNHIMATLEDRDGDFWVGTWAGLQRLDRPTGNFTLYEHEMENPASLSGNNITTLFEDSAGNLWIGTYHNGLNRFDKETNSFTHYRQYEGDPASLTNDLITSIAEDGAGRLWVGTENGLNRYDGETDSFTRFKHDPENPNSINSNYISAIGTVASDSGILWVGTAKDGINRFDTRDGTATAFRHDPSNSESLRDDRVLSVFGDRSGVLWVGTYLGGLSRSNVSSGTFAHYQYDPDTPNTLSENMIWAVLEDSRGALWVGTNSEGLNRIDRATGEVLHFTHDPEDPETLSHNSIRALLEDSRGNLWISSYGGVDRFDLGSNRLTRFTQSGKIPDLGEHTPSHALLEDRNGSLWMGIADELIRLKPETGEIERFRADKEDPYSLSSGLVLTLFEASDGTLWIGTWNGGLNRYNRENNTFTSYRHDPAQANSLSSDAVLTIQEDDSGCLWIGTTGGLNRFHPESGEFFRFTEQNSDLPANTINGILKDNNGKLWLSTHNGLARLDAETLAFRSYGVERGLQSREFNGGAYHKTKNGELLFGGINGLNAFYPDQIKDNPYAPQVALTGLSIRNELVEPGPDSPLKTHLTAARHLTLSHKENDVAFDYVALHYALPELNQYAYRLDGFDEDWRWVDTRRSAIYTNLPPGDYTFRVKAANSDGVWNEEGASISLTIRPPWWRTNGAFGLYGILLLSLMFGVDRLQRRRLVGKERERSRIREMELQAQAAEARAAVLRSENERQTRELEEARQLQLSMLPKTMPNHPSVDVLASMATATEVGGDYYDFYTGEDGSLTIAIGDATGHGANAGTMVTATKAIFNVLATEPDLAAVLDTSSRALKSMGLRKLFMALALVKLHDQKLTLAGAGMPPALIYRAATGQIDSIPLKGIPLGGPEGMEYETRHTTMAAGDTLLLMSDGFPELRHAGDMLGYEKAIEIFHGVAHKSPREIITHLDTLGQAWLNGRPPDDDITFVVVKAKQVLTS